MKRKKSKLEHKTRQRLKPNFGLKPPNCLPSLLISVSLHTPNDIFFGKCVSTLFQKNVGETLKGHSDNSWPFFSFQIPLMWHLMFVSSALPLTNLLNIISPLNELPNIWPFRMTIIRSFVLVTTYRTGKQILQSRLKTIQGPWQNLTEGPLRNQNEFCNLF